MRFDMRSTLLFSFENKSRDLGCVARYSAGLSALARLDSELGVAEVYEEFVAKTDVFGVVTIEASITLLVDGAGE